MKIENVERRNEMENKIKSETKNEESKMCKQEIGSFEFLWDLVFGSGYRCLFRLFWDLVFRSGFGFRFLFRFFGLPFSFCFF